LNGQANQALGRLDGLASILPDPALFIYLYVRKETVFSSQIEGTQSSFSDLMLFESAEAPAVPLKDVQEISNYVAAMNHGLRRLREDFPLSLRLIREIHKILLSKERGSGKHPGEFRETQNWIGGTRPGNAPFVLVGIWPVTTILPVTMMSPIAVKPPSLSRATIIKFRATTSPKRPLGY